MLNETYFKFKSKPCNISLARVCVAAFLSNTNITLDELSDIKTAVSEAVTNAIEHGYNNDEDNMVTLEIKLLEIDGMLCFGANIIDEGCGIEDVALATLPTYTTKPELEHAGMGFTIMETFMDEVEINSTTGVGTKINMIKRLRSIRA